MQVLPVLALNKYQTKTKDTKEGESMNKDEVLKELLAIKDLLQEADDALSAAHTKFADLEDDGSLGELMTESEAKDLMVNMSIAHQQLEEALAYFKE